MARFARIQSGHVAEIIEVDGDSLDGLFHPDLIATCVEIIGNDVVPVGATWNGTVFGAPPAAPTPPPIRRIRTLAFRRRFARPALEALTQAAMANAALRTYLDDLASAQYVDLDDPETAAGIASYRQAGLITQQQATALLANGTSDEV